LPAPSTLVLVATVLQCRFAHIRRFGDYVLWGDRALSLGPASAATSGSRRACSHMTSRMCVEHHKTAANNRVLDGW